MSAWLEAYNQLEPAEQERIQRWLHLQRFISETLRVPWETWIETYIGGAMERPFDYSFMDATIPGFSGLDGPAGQGESFTKEIDPATALTARVPLRAQNNLGRLSPGLQDQVSALLGSVEAPAAKLLPADVAVLQKIFAKEKALAKLKRKDFRKLSLERSGDDLLIEVQGADAPLLRMNLMEFSAVMGRAWV